MSGDVADRCIGGYAIRLGVTDRRTDEEGQHQVGTDGPRLHQLHRLGLDEGVVQLRDDPSEARRKAVHVRLQACDEEADEGDELVGREVAVTKDFLLVITGSRLAEAPEPLVRGEAEQGPLRVDVIEPFVFDEQLHDRLVKSGGQEQSGREVSLVEELENGAERARPLAEQTARVGRLRHLNVNQLLQNLHHVQFVLRQYDVAVETGHHDPGDLLHRLDAGLLRDDQASRDELRQLATTLLTGELNF